MPSPAALTRRAVAAQPTFLLPTALAVNLHHLAHLMVLVVGPLLSRHLFLRLSRHLFPHLSRHRVVATVVCPAMASVVRHHVGSAEEVDAVVSPVVPITAALAPFRIQIAPAIASLPLVFWTRSLCHTEHQASTAATLYRPRGCDLI